MDDKLEDVIKQYDLKINDWKKYCGSFILYTDSGVKIVSKTDSSATRLLWEDNVKNHILDQKMSDIDYYEKNLEGNISSPDKRGQRYTVRNWHVGREMNLNDKKEIYEAGENLAMIHLKLDCVPQGSYCIPSVQENAVKRWEKKGRCLKRVNNYIRQMKQPKLYERLWVQVWKDYECQVEEAIKELKSGSYENMYKNAINNLSCVHGSYTYHNIYVVKTGLFTGAWDKCTYGLWIEDLYYFLRKVLEKNEWNEDYAMTALAGYENVSRLSDEEYCILGAFMLYPEKFIKLSNHYLNNKKNLASTKNIDKLKKVLDYTKNRELFAKKLMEKL